MHGAVHTGVTWEISGDGKSLGTGNTGLCHKKSIIWRLSFIPQMGFILKSILNKMDATDLVADLPVVKAEASKVLKSLQLAYPWAGKFFWTTYCYQNLLSLFFLECNLFKGWAGTIRHTPASFPRHYWCFLKPLLQLSWWPERPNKIILCTQVHMLWPSLMNQS